MSLEKEFDGNRYLILEENSELAKNASVGGGDVIVLQAHIITVDGHPVINRITNYSDIALGKMFILQGTIYGTPFYSPVTTYFFFEDFDTSQQPITVLLDDGTESVIDNETVDDLQIEFKDDRARRYIVVLSGTYAGYTMELK